MSVRVYVPVTSPLLATLVAEGRLPGPLRAHAVTEALRDGWPEADEESWEYAALMAAAADSAALRQAGDVPRRYVVAADVPAADPVPGEDPPGRRRSGRGVEERRSRPRRHRRRRGRGR
ncbi:DUF6912 family protein [Nocardioides ungokensis]|uniref:DUF6912 family protein n=1 Tax=Nocardioides ungokensis TaxID=1643322 RepID=UPI003CCD26CD